MNYVLLGFICILLFLIFIYYFRYEIFGIPNSLTNEEYTTLKYGYYDTPIQTECINYSGICSEKGIISKISYCIPNAITKKGCIGKDGFQTYDTEIEQTSCTTSCRYSIWGEEIITPCYLESDMNDDCIKPNTVKGYKTLTKTCIQNDAYGMNTCSYDININSTIFDGCKLNSNGFTVECNVGSTYKEIQLCRNPINKRTNKEYEICGNWELNTKSNCGSYVDEQYFETKKCFNFENNKLLNKANMYGYTKLEYTCDKKNCSKNYDCIDENTQEGRNKIYQNSLNKISSVICNNNLYPICVKSCVSI